MKMDALLARVRGRMAAEAKGRHRGTGNHGRRTGRMARVLAAVAVVCLAAASCGGSEARPVGSLRVKSCVVAGRSARCGTLIVPEDRLARQGRTISVRFVVFPATARPRAPDPVVYFTGGPGDSAVARIPTELPLFSALGVHRDLVFIDQRGTGGSNPLSCPAFRGGLSDKAALRDSVRSCLIHLRGDLRFYTTAMYADDVSQVLAALHYRRVNLIGGSYGVTAEQVFLLRHPHRVRTMTLLSGTLLNIPIYERFPGNAQRALGYVFARCERDRSCHRAFPHLDADWASVWASLGTSPWVIPASQSPTGKTLRIDQDAFAGKLHEWLKAGNLAPIPMAIHTLGAAKNKIAAMVSLIKAAGSSDQTASGGSANPMMAYTIQCGERWASRRPQALSGQRGSFYYHGDLQTARFWQYACTLIPRSPAAAVGQQRLTVSHVPVLAFNGLADPQDPPGNMAGAHTFWPNSRELAVPGQGHNINSVMWEACLGPLAQTFIERASVAHLNAGCLATVPATPFALTLHGVAPAG